MAEVEASVDTGTRPRLPRGAWDCHVHVFGDAERFPFDPGRRYTPMRADFDALVRHIEGIGVDRVVLVQPSPYGNDHACLMDAIGRFDGRAAGVFAFDPSIPWRDNTIDRLRAAGVRGFRLHVVWMTEREALTALRQAAGLVDGTGLHLELHVGRQQIALLADEFERAPSPLVFDHFAGAAAIADVPPPLVAWLDDERAWLKLSAPYRLDQPERGGTIARSLVERFPDRCVWGSDWPHTNKPADAAARLDPVPFRSVDSALQLDLVTTGLSPAQVNAVFVTNPSRLYDATIP